MSSRRGGVHIICALGCALLAGPGSEPYDAIEAAATAAVEECE